MQNIRSCAPSFVTFPGTLTLIFILSEVKMTYSTSFSVRSFCTLYEGQARRKSTFPLRCYSTSNSWSSVDILRFKSLMKLNRAIFLTSLHFAVFFYLLSVWNVAETILSTISSLFMSWAPARAAISIRKLATLLFFSVGCAYIVGFLLVLDSFVRIFGRLIQPQRTTTTYVYTKLTQLTASMASTARMRFPQSLSLLYVAVEIKRYSQP